MPKSIISVPKSEERQDYIEGMINGQMTRFHKSKDDLSLKAEFTPKTFENKIKDVGNFKLKELYAICDALHITIKFEEYPQP